MSLDQKAPISLNFLGHEVKGQFFWVYQEIPFENTPKHLSIRLEALMDVWGDQRNIINIEGLGDLITLELTRDNKQRDVGF